MANRKLDMNSFPEVPRVVHSAVLDAFDRLEDRPEEIARLPRRRSKPGMLRVALVAACIFVLGVVIGMATAPARPVYDFNMIFDVTDTHIWTYDGMTVEVLALNRQRESRFKVEGMQHIAAVGDTVIGNAGQWIYQYSMDGDVLASWKFDAEAHIWQIEADENSIYLLACDEEYEQNSHNYDGSRLYRIDRESGAADCMDYGQMYNGIELSRGVLYAYGDILYGDPLLNIFEADGSMRSLENMDQIGNFAVDPSGKYLLTNEKSSIISRISLETGGSMLAKRLEERDYTYTGFEANSTGVYTIDHKNFGEYANEIICVGWDELLPSAEPTGQLTIVNAWDNDRLYKAIEMFNELHPEIELVFTNNDNETQLMADIMAGEGNADIVFTQIGGGADPQVMAKAGAVVNLAEYDEFMENYALWYDVSGLIASDELVYGVINRTQIYAWTYNATILNAVGVPLPQEGWTWDEFFEIGRKIDQYNRENGKNYKLLGDNYIPYLILQYHNNTMDPLKGTASYDNETFRSLISQWKEMEQLGLFGKSGSGAFNIMQTTYSSLAHQKLIYPPVYGEDARWPAYVLTGVVNANCNNIDAAVDFMTCYISPEAMTAGQFTSTGRFLADASLYPEGSLEINDVFGSNPNPENMVYWQRMLENGVAEMLTDDVLRTFQRDFYPQYLNGEIDLDTMLRQLQQRADMMLGE